ncbi:MAG: TIGR00266 family protein, partial [Crocosphaera sp.]
MSTNQHLEYQINNDPDSAYLMIKLKFSDKAFVKISALNIRDDSIQIGKAVMNDSLDLQLNFSLTSNLTIHEIT